MMLHSDLNSRFMIYRHAAWVGLVLWVTGLAPSRLAAQDETVQVFHRAAKLGDVEKVEELLEQGVDVDARSRYEATALSFAAQHGHLNVVQILLTHGATVDVRDSFYKVTPLQWAASNGHSEVVAELIRGGATPDFSALRLACTKGHAESVRLLLESGTYDAPRLSSLLVARPDLAADVKEQLQQSGGDPDIKPGILLDPEELEAFAGIYSTEDGREIDVVVRGPRLDIFADKVRIYVVEPTGDAEFQQVDNDTTKVTFHLEGEQPSALTLVGRRTERYERSENSGGLPTPDTLDEWPAIEVTHPTNWPSFRGHLGTGVADGQHPPVRWDVSSGKNIRWTSKMDGLGHSCPIVWGDDLFLTAAVSGAGEHSLRTGQYGDVESVSDESEHVWNLICLDKDSGRQKWLKEMHRGVPQVKRHLKSTHCNATPATDGTYVVINLGSEGLFCFDFDGQLKWQRELGKLGSGWFYDDALEWGFGSSPIIYEGLAILQCDIGEGSFVAAFNLETGEEVWRTERDEIPSWSTPAIFHGSERDELITSATGFVRGYDPHSGEELWRMTGMSEISIPTPVVTENLIFLASGYRTQPIFAIRGGGTGDISLQEKNDSSEFVAWRLSRGGPYIPTPIAYQDRLYVCPNSGILACYDAQTGERLYQKRLGGEGGYSASPVAADNAIYLISENGEVHVVRAGDEFKLLGHMQMNETCMATPAISDGMIFIRTQHQLYAVGQTP